MPKIRNRTSLETSYERLGSCLSENLILATSYQSSWYVRGRLEVKNSGWLGMFRVSIALWQIDSDGDVEFTLWGKTDLDAVEDIAQKYESGFPPHRVTIEVWQGK